VPGRTGSYGKDIVFIELLSRDPARFVAWVTIVAFSVCVHETVHAWMAFHQGDDTAVRLGYGAMDPRRLMGWPSLIALVLFGIAWGAVPVNPSRLRRRWSEAAVSLAGPFSNLALACLFALGAVAVARLAPQATPLSLVLVSGLEANCILALLNLLPVPPFDGWAAVTLLVPPARRLAPDQVNVVSWVLIALVLFTPASGLLWSWSDRLAQTIAAAAGAALPG